MQEVLVFATIIAPIILALVELVKQTVNFPKNYIPLVAVILGLAVGVAAQPFTGLGLVLHLWAGGLAGLSATGLFQFVSITKCSTKVSN